MKNKKGKIIETIVDSIYETSDNDVIKESSDLYGDLDSRLSAALRSIHSTVDSFDSARVGAPKVSAAAILKKSLEEKKFFLVQIFQAKPELTAQFRDFQNLSEDDVNFLIEDLHELGVID